MKIEAYFDGCCEPVNPGGTAAYGAVMYIDGKRVWEKSQLFRPKKGREKETSNNVAEYSGFLAILDELNRRELWFEDITVYGDSMLVIAQMFGDPKRNGLIWKIRGGFYASLAKQARERLDEFPNMRGHWIPRDENSLADELSKAHLKSAGVEFKIQPED